MFSLRKFVVVIAILVVAGSTSCHKGSESKGIAPSNLVGVWKLAKVSGQDPATAAEVKSWQVEFQDQGKWTFSGELTGEYEGTKMSGDGTWTLNGDQMEYTAGSNKGSTTVHAVNGSLVFSPDPVIRPHGTTAVETTYVPAGSH